jgi:NTE family protein
VSRTALVLGAGGLVGAAWMVGALRAIREESGWDPRHADCIVGTSAGAAIAALLASGRSPLQIERLARAQGIEAAASLRMHWSFPRPVLGSPELALRSLIQPWRYGPAGIVGWLPQGVVSTKALEAFLVAAGARSWPAGRCLWTVAVDYSTGARVVFGREGAPAVTLPKAVAASCAVPGFFFPVAARGRRYVDGGMYSTANLDLVTELDADVVVCLHPMSSRFRGGLLEPTGPIATIVRGDPAGRLDREVRQVTASGREVLVLEPNAADVRAMGYNYMSARRATLVAESSHRNTAARLRSTRLGRALRELAAQRATFEAVPL